MANNPTLLTQPIAANGAKNVIPNTTSTAGAMSQDQGFPAATALPLGAGGVAPSREDFNGAFNLLSGIAFMAQKGFVFNFDDTQDYYVGCVVVDPADGQKYECIVDAPVGTGEPHETPANWKKFGGSNIPVGAIIQYAVNGSLPEDFLECDGGALSRTTYAGLYAEIGTTYGAGDGTTTFNLPNLSDNRFVEGSTTAGTTHAAGLPNIKGYFGSAWLTNAEYNGAYTLSNVANNRTDGTTRNGTYKVNMDASLSSAVYNDSISTVQPKSLTLRFIIKYQ
jgi:microcystin-dependent protein